MKVIGLVTVKEESDVFPDTFASNQRYLDAWYILDDTGAPNGRADGIRGELLQAAYEDHGPHNLFCLIHADEIWKQDPREIANGHLFGTGFTFPLPLCFQPGEWDYTRGSLEQMTARLEPGYREFRMFLGAPGVAYDPSQHFNVRPHGLHSVVDTDAPIWHYPFRSPESQLARAKATWDPDNYAGAPLDAAKILARFHRPGSCYERLA